MASRKHRPQKLEGETKSWNVKYLVTILTAFEKMAEEQNIAPTDLIRQLMENYVNGPTELPYEAKDVLPWDVVDTAPLPPETQINSPNGGVDLGREYERGVMEACDFVLKSRRLEVKMSTGQTIGQDLVQTIKTELGVK